MWIWQSRLPGGGRGTGGLGLRSQSGKRSFSADPSVVKSVLRRVRAQNDNAEMLMKPVATHRCCADHSNEFVINAEDLASLARREWVRSEFGRPRTGVALALEADQNCGGPMLVRPGVPPPYPVDLSTCRTDFLPCGVDTEPGPVAISRPEDPGRLVSVQKTASVERFDLHERSGMVRAYPEHRLRPALVDKGRAHVCLRRHQILYRLAG